MHLLEAAVIQRLHNLNREDRDEWETVGTREIADPVREKKNAVISVSNCKMNMTSLLLPSVSYHRVLQYLPGFCMFVSIYCHMYIRRFGGLIKLALNGKFKLEINCHSISVVLATCSVHTGARTQAVWTFFPFSFSK